MFMDVLNYSVFQVTSCKYVMYIYSLNKLFIGKYSRHISFISTKQLCIKKVYSCSHGFTGVKWACTIRPAVENVSVLQFQQPVLKREVYFSLICLRRLSTNNTFLQQKTTLKFLFTCKMMIVYQALRDWLRGHQVKIWKVSSDPNTSCK